VDVYLGWFAGATRLVHYASALATPLSRLPAVHRALDKQARRIQRSRAEPATGETIRSDVVALAHDASGQTLAAAHLTGGDPYSFTAPILAWAAGKAAAEGVRPTGALGPVEAFGLGSLEIACTDAGFPASSPPKHLDEAVNDGLPNVDQREMPVHLTCGGVLMQPPIVTRCPSAPDHLTLRRPSASR
jgi:hypothetical protein